MRLPVLVLALCHALSCANPADEPRDGSPPADEAGKPEAGRPEAGKADAPWPAGLLVLDSVTVVDAGGVEAGRAVLIHAGKIHDVVAAGGPWPEDAQVIDATGRFVTPGLVDAHAHLSYSGATVWVGDPLEANLRASLYHGVTAVIDVGGPTMLFKLRDAIAAEKIVGPTVRATGPFLTAVGSHPCEATPENDCVFVDAGSAGQAAQGLVAQGADALKAALADADATPWPTPRLDTKALGKIAQAVSVPLIVHVNTSGDLEDAVAAGATILAHPGFVDTVTPAAVQAAAKVAGVHTTLSAFAAGPDLVDGLLALDDPHLVLGPGVKANWQAIRQNPALLAPGWLPATRGWAKNAAANIEALRQGGARLVPGSDAGYLFVPHGLGLHLELRRLEALGWSAMELLRAATLEARKLNGLPGGAVEKGAPADLLLLTGDPTKKVSALAAIEKVILGGAVHDRAALLTLALQKEKSPADGPCLSGDGCEDGLACDRVAHLCRPACQTPFAPLNSCGAGAWCMPTDGLPATPTGVCRPEKPCSLYASAGCEPAYYNLSCYPLDADTTGCVLAGQAGAGQACAYAGGGTTCKPDHFCSSIDAKCYRLCDPQQSGACPPPSTCQPQSAGQGVGWFGLCL